MSPLHLVPRDWPAPEPTPAPAPVNARPHDLVIRETTVVTQSMRRAIDPRAWPAYLGACPMTTSPRRLHVRLGLGWYVLLSALAGGTIAWAFLHWAGYL